MCECEKPSGPRKKWRKGIGESWHYHGSGWAVVSNKKKIRLSDQTFNKIYPWLLCKDGKPVAEIGDRELPAALAKAEFAIAGIGLSRAISEQFTRTGSR